MLAGIGTEGESSLARGGIIALDPGHDDEFGIEVLAGSAHFDVATALIHGLHIWLFQPLGALGTGKAIAIGSNGGGDQFHADGLAGFGLDLGSAVLVDIAGEDNGIAYLG